MVTDQRQIQDHIVDFYCALFNGESHVGVLNEVIFLDVVPLMVRHEENYALTRVPTLLEIKDIVFSLNPDSALDSNGFTINFSHFLVCY